MSRFVAPKPYGYELQHQYVERVASAFEDWVNENFEALQQQLARRFNEEPTQ